MKGGTELLEMFDTRFLKGIQINEIGFEALTSNIEEIPNQCSDKVVIEKATLEDIMFFIKKESDNAA